MPFNHHEHTHGYTISTDHHRREVADLLAAKLDAAKRVHARKLNADVFRDGADAPRLVPVTSRRSWRAYFKTLARALRGEDPYEDVY